MQVYNRKNMLNDQRAFMRKKYLYGYDDSTFDDSFTN